ncbi:LysR family transcriptional regulator [Burkholderia aenigmatica]|uniref:LysR family transcriptional regulator n=1 Tax=Burkholderia aenigmatica TaxID=2015348 RepID=A0A6P2SCD5_9BURK|nr:MULTISPECIES: LysR family transcriptional regulator [Burkholderia]MDN7514235.1 LysR family transcriptional regulator [Burkholderia sp. AU45251]VWC47854.1 LysR family transcriptional regulator [Burkholderia aenigmatica]HDR9481146.1 LysR family transcriptional regulator [Burkholderia aenigmatica]HDR9518401.1 LysR family transcriptional regulator [Burkholderia aenigmatica]HDR9595268.1 LysR family transcriptional regulator [Burkholderia aenigmatica]
MDFESIRIFLRVVERGNFTAAATHLDMPLSRVSRKVKQLEDELGVQLLYRTTRRVSVTEAGRDYYERCLRAEDILLDADRQARSLRTAPEGTLRVLVPYSIGLFELEPTLAEFRRRYPLVQLVLIYDNNPLDLVEHGFDVALRAGVLTDSSYIARSLGWSQAKLAANPAYLDRAGRPATPQDLAQHDLLLVGRDAPSLTLRLTNAAGDVADVPVRPVLITNESVTVLRQAASGGGIALVSTHYTARRLERNELEIVLPDWHRADDVELHVLYPRRATLDSKVRAFVDFLAEVFTAWRTAP